MSLPDRKNPYSFDAFLSWRNGFDYYADDPFLQKTVKHFAGSEWESVDRAAREMSRLASFRWRDLAEKAAVPERRPFLANYDGHNHRIDRIERPAETLELERAVFSQGLFSKDVSPWERLVKMFIIYQNGEACVACPLVCTEGLVALLERYADTPETLAILRHCKEGVGGEYGIGAQYLSEIHGGSDVPANLVEAVNEKGVWRLYGTKFFCSATHADYAVVTAKPSGSEKVALFVVPSWLPGDRSREKRNGFAIDRIKWKMGTSELTTAEITFNGAVAYPTGPLDRGVANVVGIVLTYSRLTVGLSAAASMSRAAREAIAYAQTRSAFGMTISDFPMLRWQLDRLDLFARRTLAGAFKLYRDFMSLPAAGGDPKKRFEVRELVMLQKIAASWDATDMLRLAMSVFGGHGVMEDFSSLPRLFRDSAINELWEGPRNVLLTQIHRDIAKASESYPPGEFVRSILAGAPDSVANGLADRMDELARADLLMSGEESVSACIRWDALCHDLFHAYQDQALAEIG